MNEKNIILAPDDDQPCNYILVSKTLINDETLSLDALGLMVFILSLPDNHDISLEKIKKRFSKENVESFLKELFEKKYLQIITR